MTKEEQRAYWKEVVDEQAASGLEATVFCRRRHIKIPQFYRWRSKFQNINREGSTSSFIQLIPNESKSESGIRIRLFENVFIEIDRGFDPVTLKTAVETLCIRG
jgi:hypothetical protein